MKMKRWLALGLVVLVLLAGCSANMGKAEADSYAPGDAGGAISNEAEIVGKDDYLVDSAGKTDNVLPENRKLIRTVNMEAETKDLDGLLAALDAKIAELGGYMEKRNIYNGNYGSSYTRRNADLMIRIPAEKADELMVRVTEQSNVVSSNEKLDDVTLSYVAIESRMKALQAEEERLLEFMDMAKNISELLEIEARLTQVRSEMETIGSQLRVYDNQIDYATINLYVWQVQELTPQTEKTVWQRIGDGFMDTLKGVGNFFVELFVFLVTASPVLVLLAIVAAAVILVIRKIIKKRPPRRPPPYYPPAPPPAPPTEG